MSNFICSECGMNNIDCGGAGYKTPKEIELEKENKRLQEQLKEANAIIDLYFPKDKKINSVCVKPINDYRKKWGVK